MKDALALKTYWEDKWPDDKIIPLSNEYAILYDYGGDGLLYGIELIHICQPPNYTKKCGYPPCYTIDEKYSCGGCGKIVDNKKHLMVLKFHQMRYV